MFRIKDVLLCSIRAIPIEEADELQSAQMPVVKRTKEVDATGISMAAYNSNKGMLQ